VLARLVKLALLFGILGIAAAAGGYAWLTQWSTQKVHLANERILDLKPGTPLASFAAALADQGVVSNALAYTVWVRLEGNYQRYQAGHYRFMGDVAPADVASTIVKGDVYNPVVLQVTIPEGFTQKLIAERLAANGVGHIVEIQHLFTEKSFLQRLGVQAPSLEGYLYPATYDFRERPTAEQALELMVKTFWQNLPKDYEKRVKDMGLTLNDAVIFASLIELETRRDEEKPLISEVIWRRLKDKVPLAIDAALIYGIPDYDGTIRWAHLADAKNPYNTRIHVGLPPTAIGSPGVKSLEAVLIPSNFGYYYYVLIPGESRHHFSKTLQEHNLNVKKLVNGTKRTKGKEKN
jgi:UPF0755 protein